MSWSHTVPAATGFYWIRLPLLRPGRWSKQPTVGLLELSSRNRILLWTIGSEDPDSGAAALGRILWWSAPITEPPPEASG